MRGGTPAPGLPAGPPWGLSPHARGNPDGGGTLKAIQGPIPACAGEPLSIAVHPSIARAYPRMRGGTSYKDEMPDQALGLSPHARGNHFLPTVFAVGHGPIPACAGEPGPRCPSSPRRGAYPRMRGGTTSDPLSHLNDLGLSPHARGNQRLLCRSVCTQGPIPACAGEPAPSQSRWLCPWAYPRMRGGTVWLTTF